MENKEKKEFLCPVCMQERKKRGHLMGSECEKEYQEQVLQALQNHQTPEAELDYAQRQAEENLSSSQKELEEYKEKTSVCWDRAYKQIQWECRRIKLPKDKFLRAVKTRFAEILEKEGMSETAELIDILKKRIYDLGQQIQWYEKLRFRQQESEESAKHKETATT